MDTIISNFTTTTGRINRQPFWIGALVLLGVNIVISLVILPMVGLGIPDIATLATAADSSAISATYQGALKASAWASLIVFAILAYPYYALSVKRRHDKDNAGLDVLIYLVLTALLLLLQALGFAYDLTEVGGMLIPAPSMLFTIFGAIVGIYGIYLLVVLGFLKGTTGPNQYGPDPLGGV